MPEAQPTDLKSALMLASSHFNDGRFLEALILTDQVLKKDPHNVTALHVSGLSKLSLGRAEEALDLLETAAAGKKSDGVIANSLAQARMAVGQFDEAARGLEKLARKNKLSAIGLNTLGDCRLRQDMPNKALACFEKALKLDPKLGAARVNIGEALKNSGNIEGAIEHYRTVIKTHPELLSAWRNLGLALQSEDLIEESFESLEYYTARNPADLTTRLSLGSSYFNISQFEKALAIFDGVLKSAPTHAEALNNRGLALRMLGRESEAENAFGTALVNDHSLDPARFNLAHMLAETKGRQAALNILDEAVALAAEKPSAPTAHVKRSQPLLSDGLIAEGWADYKWRFQEPPTYAGKREYNLPIWDGSNLSGKSILIWGEQGLGDEILYASMINDVIDIAQSVAIEVEPRLVPLFVRSFPLASVYSRSNPLDSALANLKVDWQSSIGDLCEFLRPNFDAFENKRPYLKFNQNLRAELRNKYQDLDPTRPLIGIAWRSGRKSEGRDKSIPLEQWRDILGQDAVFISLQYGAHDAEIQKALNEHKSKIIFDGTVDSLVDFDTFAAQVGAMDLVISNSNTAAHLAGALGVPTWTILPRRGSRSLLWYWFNEGTKSPWYRSMTLYRQTKWGDWSDIIDNVATDLKSFITAQEHDKI
ncbi:MAG: tetratricopeptide repeat protein [Rhodospirillaceae bacterium]